MQKEGLRRGKANGSPTFPSSDALESKDGSILVLKSSTLVKLKELVQINKCFLATGRPVRLHLASQD